MLTEKQTNKIAKIQLQLAILNGEQWAIKQVCTTPLVVVNNNVILDPEAEMRRRGIPIPEVKSKDLDKMEEESLAGKDEN